MVSVLTPVLEELRLMVGSTLHQTKVRARQICAHAGHLSQRQSCVEDHVFVKAAPKPLRGLLQDSMKVSVLWPRCSSTLGSRFV